MNVGLFSLGNIVITPAALEAFDRTQQLPLRFLSQHLTGDFGNVSAEEVRANNDAILNDLRVCSKYTLNDGTACWIITEGDGSVTTILLPSDY
jgi:hypothetical protein